MEFSIRDALVVAFKFQRRLLGVFLACVLIAVLASILLTPRYTSTATILIQYGRELVYHSDLGSDSNGGTASPLIDKDEVIASNIQVLEGDDLADRVVNTIGVQTLFPKLVRNENSPITKTVKAIESLFGVTPEPLSAQAREMFEKRLTVREVKLASMITVSYENENPQVAARAANLLVDYFQQKTLEIYSDPNIEFLRHQVISDQDGLATAETALAEYRAQNQVFDYDNQMQALIKQRGDTDSTLKGIEARVAELDGMLSALHHELQVVPSSVPLFTESDRFQVIDTTESQLLQLQLQQKDLASRYTASYPPLIALNAQIATAQDFLSGRKGELSGKTRTGPNDIYQQIQTETLQREAEYKSVLAQRVTLQGQIASLDNDMVALSNNQKGLLPLQMAVDRAQDTMKNASESLAQGEVLQGLSREKSASFAVVQRALPSDLSDPSRPLPLLYISISIAIGLLLAMAVGYISHYFSEGMLTGEELARKVGLPVLGVIALRETTGKTV